MTDARDAGQGRVSDVDQVDAEGAYGASGGPSANHRTRLTSALSAGHGQWGGASEEIHPPRRRHWPIPLEPHRWEVSGERRSASVAVRRLVVVPSLWAPFHHRQAVAALAAFAEAVQPEGIVFMNAPGDMCALEAGEAFTDILATLRAVYRGPIAAQEVSDLCHEATFNRLNVAALPESAQLEPGWRVASIDLNEQTTNSAATGANFVCGATGRLRLTGRAMPTGEGAMCAWLVLECGTLAADRAAGTLGFGILEIDGTTITARPIRIGSDGSFTYRGIRYKPPEGQSGAGCER